MRKIGLIDHRDFLNKTNELIDKFAPFRKINNYKLKLTSKPCITPGLQKSISVKKIFYLTKSEKRSYN